jgi:hypothetical protein
MKYLATCIVCVLALISVMPAQQVGYVDLTSPPLKPIAKRSEMVLPPGCKNPGGGFFDGFKKPEDGITRTIVLELIKVDDHTLYAGSEFVGEVRLTNAGNQAIQIPWSTDETITDAGPDPNHADFEVGDFDVSLVFSSGSVVALKSLSSPLFGSKYATGSERKIEPGEWITARIKVKVDAEYDFDRVALTEGKAQLSVEWRQRVRSWSLNREKCEVWRGTFPYYHYYDQQSKPTAVALTKLNEVKPGNKDTALK